MLKTVLVPLDGSQLAEHALPYATSLARALEARIVLLHVRRTDVDAPEGAPDLQAVADRLTTQGVAVETHTRHTPSVEETGRAILEAAADVRAELIVMATHGRGGIGRWLYGSVADQVLRQTTLPLLLVSPLAERPWPADRPPRVLVPLDGSEVAESVLRPLTDLLGPLRPALTVLRVAEMIDFAKPHGDECAVCRAARAAGEEPGIEPVTAQRYVEDVATRLRASGTTVEAQMEIGQPSSEIVRLARDRDVDLIAMATHGRGGLARVVLGSVAADTLRRAHVPMLLFRAASVRPAASSGPAQ